MDLPGISIRVLYLNDCECDRMPYQHSSSDFRQGAGTVNLLCPIAP